MQKILIATSNKEKFKEIAAELADMHFQFVSLKDLGLDKITIEEPYDTTWQNAIEKASFFAKKSGLLTLAEDTGLFINYLKGQPGIKSKRYASTALARNTKILEQLKDVPNKKRHAYFETTGCLFDPKTDNFFAFNGRSDGLIADKMGSNLKEDMGYDPIFYFPSLKKLFSEMSILEKNEISHRGKMINQVRYFLMKNYQPQQIICAAAIIIDNGKIYMQKRRDHRAEFNNKWELPGGGVEGGASIIKTLKDEIKEETSLKVRIEGQLPDILTATLPKDNYQVHLCVHICSKISGVVKIAKAESSDYGWFTYKEALQMDLMPLNKKLIQTKNNKKMLLKYLK